MTSVLIPVYKGVTHLDFTGPHQFLSRTPGIEVVVASMGASPIESYGLTFSNLADLALVERCDVLCIPGGVGCVEAMEDTRFLSAILRLARTAKYLTSVCTGSLILGAAGLLEGRRACCHWAWRDMLPYFGAIPDEGRVVRDGNIITGGGVTAGIDLALTLIGELCGTDVAQQVQLLLEYAPDPPFGAGLPGSAPQHVHDAVLARMADSITENRLRVRNAALRIREQTMCRNA